VHSRPSTTPSPPLGRSCHTLQRLVWCIGSASRGSRAAREAVCGGPGMLLRSIHASAPFGPTMAVKVCGPAQLPAAGVSSSSACSKHLKLSARRPARRTSGCAAGRQLLLPPSQLPPVAMAEPCQQLSSIHSSSSSCKGATQPITADGKIPTGRPEQFYRTEWSHIVQAQGARNEMSSPTCSATPASTATPDHPQRLCTPPTHTLEAMVQCMDQGDC